MRSYRLVDGSIYDVERVVNDVEIVVFSSGPYVTKDFGVLGFFNPFEIYCSAMGVYVEVSTGQQIPVKDLPSRLDRHPKPGNRMILRAVDRDGKFEDTGEGGLGDIVTQRIYRTTLR